jgi:hypothetical protein
MSIHEKLARSLSGAAAALALLATPGWASTGQVSNSGGTWTASVDGVTKYTGSSLTSAANACVSNMSSGTIYINNSGTLSGSINTKSNIIVDGKSHTLTSSGTTGIIHCQNSSSVGARNIIMAGSNWFGMYFLTCNGQSFSGVTGSAGIDFRIDDCKGGLGYNFTLDSPSLGSGGDNAVETYGISGVKWGSVTATDRGACGLLLNYSSSASGTSVSGTRCNYGGGYASFRTANTNGTTTLGSVYAQSCGRGYFSVSGSKNCTVSSVNINNTSSHGVWLQTTGNSHVNGGTVTNGHPCTSISSDLGGNSISVACR